MAKIYQPEDVNKFGKKNKGLPLSEIYHYEPTYIEWMIVKISEFAIDIEAFERLPKPTPIATGAVTGSKTRKEIFKKFTSLMDKYNQTDNVNMLTNVHEIKRAAESNPELLEEVNFKFSKEAREANAKKLSPAPNK